MDKKLFKKTYKYICSNCGKFSHTFTEYCESCGGKGTMSEASKEDFKQHEHDK